MDKTKKQIFKNRDEELKFYETIDIDQYIKTLKEVNLDHLFVVPTKSISIRLPVNMLNKLKERAGSIDIAYQSLIKYYIQEGLDKDTQNSKL